MDKFSGKQKLLRIQEKSERLGGRLKRAAQKAEKRTKVLSDLEEGVRLLQEESKKFDEETKEAQRRAIHNLLFGIGGSICVIGFLVVFLVMIFGDADDSSRSETTTASVSENKTHPTS